VDLKEYGVVQRAMLGVQYSEIDSNFIEQRGEELGIKEVGGAYIQSVSEGGAAKAAGIKEGDIFVSIDGTAIDSSAKLSEIIGRHRPNDKVKVEVKRDGKLKQFEVTLRNKAGKTGVVSKDDVDAIGALGGQFAEASAKLCKQLRIDGGVRVVSISDGGFLAKARVRVGFIITHVNEQQVTSVGDLERISDKITSVDGIYPSTGRAVSYSLVE